MCGPDLRYSIVMATESYVQPVHQPYITLCQGHRLCSTYKYANAGGKKTTERHTLGSSFKEEKKANVCWTENGGFSRHELVLTRSFNLNMQPFV